MSDVLHTIVNPELFNSKLSGVNTDDCRGAYRDYWFVFDSPIEAKYEINGEIVLYQQSTTHSLAIRFYTTTALSYIVVMNNDNKQTSIKHQSINNQKS
jgi:hypothetical protein